MGVVLEMTSSDNEFLSELQNLLRSPDANMINPEAVSRLTLATLINMERRLREVEKMTPVVRVMLWVGAAIGASVVGLIWSVIVGSASIIFN